MPAQQKRRIVTFGLASLGAAALAACSPVKLLNATIPSSGYRKSSGIAYGSDPRQVLDVYVPAAAASTQPRPVVVFFYGGSWQTGDRANYLFVAGLDVARLRGGTAGLPHLSGNSVSWFC
jgi:acetyl esterase/lipase